MRRASLRLADLVYRAALLPYRRPQGPGLATEDDTLVARTAELNAAAEDYYARYPDAAFLRNKPFSETALFAHHLIDVGHLVAATRLRPGDRVGDLGAGSCWLSHFLNRLGCHTVSLDVSASALAVGRTLFERDPSTDWTLHPRFVTYDGHTLPLPDASLDRVLINDAFHHVPNQREVLTEIHRVLTPDGVLAMSEPGRGHGTAPSSRDERERTGVLENELVLEDLAALGESVGFTAVTVLAAAPGVRPEIDARALGRFLGGRGFARFWKAFTTGLEQHHYVLMHKGRPEPTTARPGTLVAQIDTEPVGRVTARVGRPTAIRVRLTNTGDTVWLAGPEDAPGWTRLGAQRLPAGDPTRRERDWHRAALPRDIAPDETDVLTVELPPVTERGDLVVELDLVIEGMTWFTERGSRPATVTLDVR